MRERRHQSNMCDWSRKDKSDREVRFVCRLPLQSGKGHMHTIRTIDIVYHKQWAVCACMHLSDSCEHVFTNEQAGTNKHGKNSHRNYHAMWSRQIPVIPTIDHTAT